MMYVLTINDDDDDDEFLRVAVSAVFQPWRTCSSCPLCISFVIFVF